MFIPIVRLTSRWLIVWDDIHVNTYSKVPLIVIWFSLAWRHYKLGNVVWDAVKILIPTLMLSTFVFTGIVSQLDKSLSSKLFAVLVAYMAIRMVISTKIQIKNTKSYSFIISYWWRLIGIVSSIAGIGGGGFYRTVLNSPGCRYKESYWIFRSLRHAIRAIGGLQFYA